MFCPKCESEYRPGFSRCADCGVDLVDHLVEEISSKSTLTDNELVSVLETQDSRLLDKLIAKLESKNIPYLLQSGTAFDGAGLVESDEPLAWKASLWIPISRSDEVKSLVQKLRNFLESKKDTE